jgi:hypothetical protein
MPAFYTSAGIQGIGTGNPGYSLTAEKNWHQSKGQLNTFVGIGFRSNESHSHLVAGTKYMLTNGLSVGVQAEGHNTHPFLTYSRGPEVVGIYLINGRRLATMVGIRF